MHLSVSVETGVVEMETSLKILQEYKKDAEEKQGQSVRQGDSER